MMKLLRSVAIVTILFTATEGFTSQIGQVDSGVSLESFAEYSSHVVIVKPSDKWETYKEIHVGTRKERDRAPEEIYYKEQTQEFEVVEVLKSPTIKPGDVIKAWRDPGYSLQDMKSIAEGMNLYKVSMKYKSKYPPKDGQNRILFLGNNEDDKAVYNYSGEENISAKAEVEKSLKK